MLLRNCAFLFFFVLTLAHCAADSSEAGVAASHLPIHSAQPGAAGSPGSPGSRVAELVLTGAVDVSGATCHGACDRVFESLTGVKCDRQNGALVDSPAALLKTIVDWASSPADHGSIMALDFSTRGANQHSFFLEKSGEDFYVWGQFINKYNLLECASRQFKRAEMSLGKYTALEVQRIKRQNVFDYLQIIHVAEDEEAEVQPIEAWISKYGNVALDLPGLEAYAIELGELLRATRENSDAALMNRLSTAVFGVPIWALKESPYTRRPLFKRELPTDAAYYVTTAELIGSH